MTKLHFVSLIRSIFFLLLLPLPAISQEYVLIAWNDLGMHCANQSFAKVAVLPPFNNVNAQLILKYPGQPPQIVTSGYSLEYSIPNNTYSVGKTNFWTYAQQLFGLSSPLPANIGLTGKGLTGTLDSSGNYFSVHGIPVTPFPDSDIVHENPFQLIHVVAKNKATGAVLATTDAVIPVSNEVGCVQSGCHASENDILNSHEQVSGFNRNGPVLCASCHASNALGTVGNQEAGPFSMRIHGAHSQAAGPSMAISTCYKCHPGPKTQCLRDIMGKNPTNPLVCQNCHGTMDSVATSIRHGRQPWLQEPSCGNCHGANYAEEPGKLFRQSEGHGGLFCSACHSSPHAILPSVQPNDNLQNIRLQGFAGTLRKCSVCHATPPTGPGPHGILDTVFSALQSPVLVLPANAVAGITTNPRLQWSVIPYAQSYRLQVSSDSGFGTTLVNDSTITQPYKEIGPLGSNGKYFWRVLALNQNGHSAWSDIWNFTTGTGLTFTYAVNGRWNIVSLPLNVGNPRTSVQFPSAISPAYSYLPNAGYVMQDTLTTCTGYWMKFNTAQSVNLTGTTFSTDTMDVAPGWNLIGALSNPVPTNSIAVLGTSLSSEFFAYNAGYSRSDTIAPSRGYWVKVSNSGKLVLGAGTNAQKSTMNSHLFETLNELIVEDAAGNLQHLYFGKRPQREHVGGGFEMPPPPPDDAFDVRFTTGTFVEFIDENSSREIPISLSSSSYPLLVKWKLISPQRNISISVNGKEISMRSTGSISVPDPKSSLVLNLGPASEPAIPQEFALEQNYPNPFNPGTVIKYHLPAEGKVVLKIYNVVGEVITTLVNSTQAAGSKSVEWNSENYPSGIYFYRIEVTTMENPVRSFMQGKKMLLIK